MGFSQAQKAESRKKVVETASRQIREKGIEGLGVAECMRGAGLTQGAFYGHFASRDALIVEALEHALDTSHKRINAADAPTPEEKAKAKASKAAAQRATQAKSRQQPDLDTLLPSFVDRYLSMQHVGTPGQGCALAALAGEGRHAEKEVRALLTQHVKRFSARMSAAAGTDDVAGLRIVTMLVGALTLARTVDDPALAEQILAGAREQILSAASKPA